MCNDSVCHILYLNRLSLKTFSKLHVIEIFINLRFILQTMTEYDLGGITIDTNFPAVHEGNKITLIPPKLGVTLILKYNAKKHQLIFWQPTGWLGLGKALGIQVHDLKKINRPRFHFEGASEYKEHGQRVFAKTRVHWFIRSSDSVKFKVTTSY